MKNWMFCAVLTLVFGAFTGGCAEDTAKPCTGANCVSDAEIVANIEAEIGRHSDLTDWTINVQSNNGIVYLHGMVDTDPQRQLLEDIAREIRGVMGVENAIELRNSR